MKMITKESHWHHLEELEVFHEKLLQAQYDIELYQAQLSKDFNKKV